MSEKVKSFDREGFWQKKKQTPAYIQLPWQKIKHDPEHFEGPCSDLSLGDNGPFSGLRAKERGQG